MINNIINAMSEEQFRLRAFADYCEDRATAYSNLIAAVTDAVSEASNEATRAVSNKISDICAKYGLDPNMEVTIQQGYLGKLQPFLEQVLHNTKQFINDDAKFDNDALYNLFSAAEDNIGSLNFEDIISDMKSGYHSLVVLCASNAAFLSSDLSSRFTVFRDKLSQVFANSYDDVSSMGAYCTELLQNCSRPQEYMEQVFKRLNVEEVAADQSEVVPSNSDIHRFTGASPLGALDFSTATAGINSVVNAGAKVVAGIGAAVWAGAKWLFNKAKRFVTEIVADPYDIYKVDGASKNATPSVDGFFYQSDAIVDYFMPSYTVSQDVMNSMSGSYYTIKLLTGEVVLQVNSFAQGGGSGELSCNYMVQLKPLPITREFAYSILDVVLNDGYTSGGVAYRRANWNSSNIGQLSTKLGQLVATNPNPYYDVSDNENDLRLGFNLGYLITALLLKLSSIEAPIVSGLDSSASLNWNSKIQPSNTAADIFPSPNNSTNIDFIKAVCGYDAATNLFNKNSFSWGLVVNNDSFWNELLQFDNVGWYVFNTMAMLQSYKIDNPLNYQFFAYRKNKERFTESMYAIHTDAENQDTANRFIAIAVVVLAVVAVVVAGAVASKIISKAMTLRRSRLAEEAKFKQLLGLKPSFAEKRALIKTMKSTSVVNQCSSGLLGSLGDLTSTNDSDITAILNMIA